MRAYTNRDTATNASADFWNDPERTQVAAASDAKERKMLAAWTMFVNLPSSR